MNCIILGDKYQKGMKSKGCSALMKANKKTTILDNQYELLTSNFQDISITYVYGFDSKRLLEFIENGKYNMDMIYNKDYEKYNDAFSMSLVANKLNDDTLIVLGYQTLTSKILKKLYSLKDSKVFVSTEIQDPKIGCIIYDNDITTFNFGLNNHVYDIYYLDKKCSTYLKDMLQTTKYHNYFLFELLNKLLDSGLTIKPIMIS